MKRHIRILRLLVVAGVIATYGCSKPDTLPDVQGSNAASDLAKTETLLTPKQRAVKAKDELFKRLSSELMTAMSNGGPSAAIEVCSQMAPKIAEEVGKDHGVSIGRTSFKLRNPSNTPPQWAVKFVADRVTEPQFVALEGEGTGAFLPIRLKTQCLVCHGPKDQIAEEVRDRLAALYPDDAATGFQEGDLRGWFWVEVGQKVATSE